MIENETGTHEETTMNKRPSTPPQPMFPELQLRLVIIEQPALPDPNVRGLEATCYAMTNAELDALTRTARCDGGGTGGMGH